MKHENSLTRYKSLNEIARLIRSRDVSPVEILESVISDIDQYNSKLNAFVYLGVDDAKKAAKNSEIKLMKGTIYN
tara:strand:- start:1187 stop:1411 length:225 start_codon:yes stop_codon:yes gene_type:complete